MPHKECRTRTRLGETCIGGETWESPHQKLGLSGIKVVSVWPSGEPVGMDAGKLLASRELPDLRWVSHWGHVSGLK